MAWENIVLLAAESCNEAMRKAEVRGRSEAEGPDDSTTLDGKPARWVFAGVRKVVLCSPSDEKPGEGTELTYNAYYLKSRDDVAKPTRGDSVTPEYNDGFENDD